MNRVRKWRVYDTIAKTMRYIDAYWFEENDVRNIPEDMPPGMVLIDFTGLQDAEGNDIYEGDVVEEGIDPTETAERRYVVEYARGSFGLKGKVGDRDSFFIFASYSEGALRDCLSVVRIVGNIHEHELLNNQQGA